MVANGRRGLSSFKNVTPGSNTSYWSSFGASFESIATGLLFAEKATIAGMDFITIVLQLVVVDFS